MDSNLLNPIDEARDMIADAALDFQYFINDDFRDIEKFIQGMKKIVAARDILEDKTFCKQCKEGVV